MNPRGTIGMIYKEDHCTLLHTNMKALGHVVSERKTLFLYFPIVSLWELSVAIETRVLIQRNLKPTTTFLLPK